MLAPFNLQTEERGRKKTKTDVVDDKSEEKEATFKARKMPTYKFFEVAKAPNSGAPQFEPFNLKTSERSESRKRLSLPQDQA